MKGITSTDKSAFLILHFLVVTYEMAVLRYAIDVFETVVVCFLCLSNF